MTKAIAMMRKGDRLVQTVVDGDEDSDDADRGNERSHQNRRSRGPSSGNPTFSRFYCGNVGRAGGKGIEDEHDSAEIAKNKKPVGRYNPLFHKTENIKEKEDEPDGTSNSPQTSEEDVTPGTPRSSRRKHFLEFNPKVLDGFMRVDMKGFLTQPVPKKGGTVKCFIRREKEFILRGHEVYKLYMEGEGDIPDRYLMTAKKKGGISASQFVVTTGEDGDDSNERNVVGRLKATSRASQEFQVFCPFSTPDPYGEQGVVREREVAAVLYPPDNINSHGGYDGPRNMRVALAKLDGDHSDVEAETSLLHRMLRGSLDQLEEPCLVNRSPQWKAKVQAFVLNFYGRVTQASVKNFQLIMQGDTAEQITLQFGRTQANEFTMDFRHPLSPLQALTISLTSFDCK